MAKSPNGKIVKSLYLKIAYVWTRPNIYFSLKAKAFQFQTPTTLLFIEKAFERETRK